MKYILTLLFGCGLLMAKYPVIAQQTGSLKIIVNNIKTNEGVVYVALFNNEETFLEDDKEFRDGSARPDGSDKVTIVIDDLPPGRYGISVIHDVNDNDELDTNFMGIPKEPFGFGNDTMGAFGPPGFQKASVEVKAGEQTVTTLKLKSF